MMTRSHPYNYVAMVFSQKVNDEGCRDVKWALVGMGCTACLMNKLHDIIMINMPSPKFLQARYSSCHTTNSVRAQTGKLIDFSCALKNFQKWLRCGH